MLLGGLPRPLFTGGAEEEPTAPAPPPCLHLESVLVTSSEDLDAATEAIETESALEASTSDAEEVEAHSDLARFRFMAARSKLDEIFFSICFAACEWQ